MRGTESIEEVDERNLALDCSQMCNRSQIHNFLHAGGAQHSCTGLTACINVGVITKNIQRMRRYCTRGYIKYARKLFARNFVQVRNHQ